MSNSLDLYAKLEPMIPFNEELEGLYEIFADEVKLQNRDKILDVGCGSGKFAKLLMKNGLSVKGTDLSSKMVERAKKIGVDAEVKDICKVEEKYPCITAVFDVLNYLDPQTLEKFLGCITASLEEGGVFIADINTEHGFEDVAQGAILLEDREKHGSINSDFDGKTLISRLNLFEKQGKFYKREEGEIIQYFHPMETFLGREDLKLIKTTEIFLFSEESDKTLLVLEKR